LFHKGPSPQGAEDFGTPLLLLGGNLDQHKVRTG